MVDSVAWVSNCLTLNTKSEANLKPKTMKPETLKPETPFF